MKKYLMPLVIVLLLMSNGCDWFGGYKKPTVTANLNTKNDIKKAQEIITESSANIEKASTEIVSEAENIKTETTKIGSTVSEEDRMSIDPYLTKIQKHSDSIIADSHKITEATAVLASTHSYLDSASEKVGNIEGSLKKIEEERDALIKKLEEKNSEMDRILTYIIVGCVILAGLFGVFFIFYQNKIGLVGAACCAVVMAIAIFVKTYFVYLAIAGGVIIVLLIAGLIYCVIIRRRAFKQVIDTVEVVKDNIPVETKTKLFGGEGETGIMDTIQTNSTMKLIKAEKNKLGNLWKYAKRKNGG